MRGIPKKRQPKCDDCKKFISAERSFFFPLHTGDKKVDESLILCKGCWEVRNAQAEREYLEWYEHSKRGN